MWKFEKIWEKFKLFQNKLKEKELRIEKKYWKKNENKRKCEHYVKKVLKKKMNQLS